LGTARHISAERRAGRTWAGFIAGRLPTYTDLHERHGNHFSGRREKLKAQNDVILQLRHLRIPGLACVRLVYHHVRKDRCTDKSNIAAGAGKIIEDALVDMEIIRDDGWNFVHSFEHTFEIGAREGTLLTVVEML
jgi:hypothetical protein